MTTPFTGPEHLEYWTRAHRSPRPRKFVYVISSAGSAGPIKVGKATRVYDRIAQFQTGNPFTLDLLYVLVGYTDLERALHEEIRSARVGGEWFSGPEIPPFLEFVAALADRMKADYQSNKRLPNFTDYSPWKDRAVARRAAMPSRITDEQLAHKGRLSSPNRRIYQGDSRDLRFKHAAEQVPTFSPHRS